MRLGLGRGLVCSGWAFPLANLLVLGPGPNFSRVRLVLAQGRHHRLFVRIRLVLKVTPRNRSVLIIDTYSAERHQLVHGPT